MVYIEGGEVMTFGCGQQVPEQTFVCLAISFLVIQ